MEIAKTLLFEDILWDVGYMAPVLGPVAFEVFGCALIHFI